MQCDLCELKQILTQFEIKPWQSALNVGQCLVPVCSQGKKVISTLEAFVS